KPDPSDNHRPGGTTMILVTGATGTVGSSTVKALKARGARLKAAVRNPEKAAGLGVETVHFDWARPDTFPAALQGAEALFIQANMVEQQAGQVSALLGAAKAAGVRHVVDLSVVGADTEPGITFGRMHRAEEKLIEAS